MMLLFDSNGKIAGIQNGVHIQLKFSSLMLCKKLVVCRKC